MTHSKDGADLRRQPDGSLRWLPVNPAVTGLDKDAFEKELRTAQAIEQNEGQSFWWEHNGVRVESDFILNACFDPWGWLTERSSQMAN